MKKILALVLAAAMLLALAGCGAAEAPAAAETIARETGAKLYSLDPVVTGEATPDAKDAYLDAMRKNMETLKEALQ